MTWLIFTILFGIVGGGAFFVGMAGHGEKKQIAAGGGTMKHGDASTMTTWGFGVFGVVLFGWLLLTLFTSIHTVGQRQVGIVYNFSGTITGKKDPGVIMTFPWQHIRKENVGLQREDFELDPSNSAVSLDQQSIYARITVNFQVEPSKVVELYKTVGPAWKQTLLDSRVLQDFKEVTSQYTAAEITTKRPQLRSDTKQRLREEMARYDIRVVDIFVRNIGYSAAYEKAINAKNVQVQRSLQAEAKVQQARAEGEQQLALARKQAQANRLLTKSITTNLIRLRSIEKLNPKVQVIYMPSNSNLFLPSLGK